MKYNNIIFNILQTQPFWFPVSAKNVPDYHRIIQRPMDLQTMREKLHQKKYKSREEFLEDVNQIVENSTLYNGNFSIFILFNKFKLLEQCIQLICCIFYVLNSLLRILQIM